MNYVEDYESKLAKVLANCQTEQQKASTRITTMFMCVSDYLKAGNVVKTPNRRAYYKEEERVPMLIHEQGPEGFTYISRMPLTNAYDWVVEEIHDHIVKDVESQRALEELGSPTRARS
jgi:hypothetical protein